MTIARDEVERLLKLAEGATPGAWGVDELSEEYFLDTNHKYAISGGLTGRIAKVEGLGGECHTNAQFIAACREAVPALCRQLLDAMRLVELWRERANAAAKAVRRGSFPEGNCAEEAAFNLAADELEAALSRAGSEVVK